MIKVAVAALAILPWAAAQTTPDLSGVWELNQAKSSASQGARSPKLKIEQQGSTLSLVFREPARADPITLHFTVGQDSKTDMSGVPVTIRSDWDGAILVVVTDASVAGRKLHSTERWALSSDRNTLTTESQRQITDQPDQTATAVYNRAPASSWGPDDPPKLAEDVYKNIQIMKGVPVPQFNKVMVNLSTWLGVSCDHCHVTGAMEKDDLLPKQTARKMFTMVRGIGKDYFGGPSPVTCWTCHRGQAKPQFLPPL